MGVEYHISEAVAKKLREKHNVSEAEVLQCFQRRQGKYAYDTRPEHQTGAGIPTLWFIGETETGRRLKVTFMRYGKTDYIIKSAFEPNTDEERLYEAYRETE